MKFIHSFLSNGKNFERNTRSKGTKKRIGWESIGEGGSTRSPNSAKTKRNFRGQLNGNIIIAGRPLFTLTNRSPLYALISPGDASQFSCRHRRRVQPPRALNTYIRYPCERMRFQRLTGTSCFLGRRVLASPLLPLSFSLSFSLSLASLFERKIGFLFANPRRGELKCVRRAENVE